MGMAQLGSLAEDTEIAGHVRRLLVTFQGEDRMPGPLGHPILPGSVGLLGPRPSWPLVAPGAWLCPPLAQVELSESAIRVLTHGHASHVSVILSRSP